MVYYKANKVGDDKIENCDHQITSDHGWLRGNHDKELKLIANELKSKLKNNTLKINQKIYFTINKKKRWITNLHSRKRAHVIRSTYDCLISTSKSIYLFEI